MPFGAYLSSQKPGQEKRRFALQTLRTVSNRTGSSRDLPSEGGNVTCSLLLLILAGVII